MRLGLFLTLAALGATFGASGATSAQVSGTQPAAENAAPSNSSQYRTRQGFAACRTAEGLAKLVANVAQGDSEAHRAMLADPESGCFLLRPGVVVTPVGFNDYIIEVRPAGMEGTIFTVVEAIEEVKVKDDR